MNRRHPIDSLFRAKLERRSFPVEEKELDDVRSLIDLSNASHASRGGIAHWAWWWSLLLVPAFLGLWFMEAGGANRDGTTGTKQNALLNGALVRDERGTMDQHSFRIAVGTRTLANTLSVASSSPEMSDAHNAPVNRRTMQKSTSSNGSSDEMRPMDGPRKESGDINSLSGSIAVVHDPDLSQEEDVSNLPMSYLRVRLEDTESRLFSSRSTRPAEALSLASRPLREKHELGDLHFIGSMTTLDAPSVVGTGSMAGVEYRLKKGHLSAAMGMQYGSYHYIKNAADNDCDVKLEYIQLPLLAGYEIGFGRWGVLAQTGLTCDLFFTASGNYKSDVERSTTSIDDGSFRTVNFQVLVRPQLTFRATEQLGLVAGPVWSHQLAEMAMDGPLAGARANSTGVSLGIIWRLTRSTY